MNTYANPNQRLAAVASENARFMSRVYAWMTGGILVTWAVSFYVGTTPSLVLAIFYNPVLLWGMVLLQLGAVIFLSAAINRISSTTATLVYLLYAALTGVTLSSIFLAYTRDSIAPVFATTAFAFGGLSAFGYLTRRDLGPVGSFCSMGLFGLIGFWLLSMFFPGMRMNESLQQASSALGVLIFAGLTAYDTQRIKAMNVRGYANYEDRNKGAIYGALTLYLDFINLFLMMLRLFGRRK